MTIADPVPSLRRRRWATPVGAALMVLAAVLVVVAAATSSIPALPAVLSMVAGFAIGIGYQFLPFLHGPGSRVPNRRLGVWLVAAAGGAFAAAVVVVAFRWVEGPGGSGAVLLAVSLAALLVGLTELFPAGENLPGVFLIPVGLDGLMLQSLAPQWAQPAQLAVSLALFAPATGAAVVLTVWAFRVRGAGKVAYTKATETARGVL